MYPGWTANPVYSHGLEEGAPLASHGIWVQVDIEILMWSGLSAQPKFCLLDIIGCRWMTLYETGVARRGGNSAIKAEKIADVCPFS